MRSLRHLVLIPLFMLAACAVPFQSRVVRFNQLPPSAAGGTFVVQASEVADAGGLEFQLYAQEVTRRLVAEGFQPAASPAQAALLVTLDYGVDEGRERVETRPGFGRSFGFGYGGFGYGGFGRFPYRYSRFGGYFGYGSGFYDPFWGPFGYSAFDYPEVYSYTLYGSFVDVRIRRTATSEVVFEGRAEADSRTRELPRLVPNLVQALFTGFPGRSGETVRVSIDDKGQATTRIAAR